MKLKDLKKQMEEKSEDIFMPDRKDWQEQLQVLTYDDDEEDNDYYDYTTDIFICKEGENTWVPKIYWVKVKRQVFDSLVEGLEEDNNFIFQLEWGNDSGLESVKLEIRSVTKYFVYLSPEGWEEDEDE